MACVNELMLSKDGSWAFRIACLCCQDVVADNDITSPASLFRLHLVSLLLLLLLLMMMMMMSEYAPMIITGS